MNPKKDSDMAAFGCLILALLMLGFTFLAIIVIGAAVRIAF